MAQQELRILVKADGTAQVTRQLDGVNQSINRVDASKNKLNVGKDFMKGMVSGALTAAAAYLSVRTALRLAGDALDNFNNAAMTIRQVQATLNSTGRSAEFTTEQLGAMASGLQQVSNYGDEDILKNATIGLLRFDSISKDMFPRVQQLVIDMADSMGGLENATKTLGISIADPILGMTRLRRAGVMLNQDQQDLIKSLVETGKTAEAQGVLLTALESKYGGLAMAGVTASQQLKNAWGDYLETIGGSISAFDGVKKGMAQFFTGVASNSDALSKTQMKHILDVQERWALATHDFMVKANAAIKIISGTVALHVGGITQIIKVAYAGWQEAINGFLTAWIDMSRYIIKYNPFSIILKANKELLKIMGVDIKLDFIDQEQLVMLDKAQSAINKLFPKSAAASVDEAGNAILQWGKNLLAAGTDAAKAFSTGTDEITKFYDAQRKLVESGKNPFTGADIAEGEDAGALLKQIDANQAKAVERLGNTTGDMLSAWAAYYTSLDQYSNESIEHQANLYKYQLQQQYGTILSMQQIDEMYNAKLWELRDAQLAHFAENYEEMPEIAKTAYEKMQEYAANMASTIKDQAFNALENSIYSLMAETKSLKDVWKSAWAAIKDIALRAMADIIVQTLRTIAIQSLLKAVMGIFSGGAPAFIGPSNNPNGFDFSIPTKSIGGGGLGSLPTGGNGNSDLLMAINGLRSDLSQNQNPNFQLLLDGKELHHGLKRVSSRLNYMGARA